jgi:peptidoglycan/LPS O-acetylase OafA/YrhL
MEPPKYAYIDSLRGFAIMLVLLVHTSQLVNRAHFSDRFISFLENGQLGVQLFYLVSAFTLMLSCQSREGEADFTKKFFIRRFFRIAPLYYLATVYYTFERYLGFDITHFNENLQHIPYVKLVTGVFFVNGFYPTTINSYVPGGWSIAIEMTFYLLLPFLFHRIRQLTQGVYVLFFSILLASVFSVITKHPFFDRGGFPMFNFVNQIPIFCLGIVAYFIFKDGWNQIKSKDYLLIAFLFFLACYLPLPYYLPYSMFFFFLLLGLAQKSSILFVNGITVQIGKLSFSIYLVHFAVLYWSSHIYDLRTLVWDNALMYYLSYFLFYIVILFVSVLISYVTYTLVEKPGMKFGKRVIASL